MANYGDWKIKDNLSGGGQGSTHLAFRNGDETEELFVLKKIKNKEKIHRFNNEVTAGLQLEHPNILKIVDYQIEGNNPFLVSEFCSGGTLKDLNFKNLSDLEKLSIFLQICQAVGFAHSKKWTIVHRDLKPENIFLKADKLTPVVGDFGICFIDDDGERFTLVDEAVGARRYTAPELEDGRQEDIKPSSDVYSLGKILYWIFAEEIFDREKQNDERWDLRKKSRKPIYFFIYELLNKTVIINPEERLNDANEVANFVKGIISRVMANAHALDFIAPQRCLFCGIGIYEKMLQVPTTEGNQIIDWKSATIRIKENRYIWQKTKIILLCKNCGNEQVFQPLNKGWEKLAWKNYPPKLNS